MTDEPMVHMVSLNPQEGATMIWDLLNTLRLAENPDDCAELMDALKSKSATELAVLVSACTRTHQLVELVEYAICATLYKVHNLTVHSV